MLVHFVQIFYWNIWCHKQYRPCTGQQPHASLSTLVVINAREFLPDHGELHLLLDYQKSLRDICRLLKPAVYVVTGHQPVSGSDEHHLWL